MDAKERILAALEPGGGEWHTPVQVQKLVFLMEDRLKAALGEPEFEFQPYHYGPFDKRVYRVLEQLNKEGLVEMSVGGRWTEYRLTETGRKRAGETVSQMAPEARMYLQNLSQFVRSLSFTDLVSAIYKAYPDMQVNSVFRG